MSRQYPISIRLEASVRDAVERAAHDAGVGVTTFIGDLVRRWEKEERERRIESDCKRIARLPMGGDMKDEPADLYPEIAAYNAAHPPRG
jgi:hypothetical protein